MTDERLKELIPDIETELDVIGYEVVYPDAVYLYVDNLRQAVKALTRSVSELSSLYSHLDNEGKTSLEALCIIQTISINKNVIEKITGKKYEDIES